MLEASEKSTRARVSPARTRIVVASMLTVTSWMCPFPSRRPAATNSIGALTPSRSSGRASTAHPNTSAARAMIAPSLIDRPRSEATVPPPVPSGSSTPVRRTIVAHGFGISLEGITREGIPQARHAAGSASLGAGGIDRGQDQGTRLLGGRLRSGALRCTPPAQPRRSAPGRCGQWIRTRLLPTHRLHSIWRNRRLRGPCPLVRAFSGARQSPPKRRVHCSAKARCSATAYTGASATVNAWTLSITRHTVPRPCLEPERPESHDAADSCVHDVSRHHSGGDGGIRTLTGGGLSALPLPVGLRPRGHLAEEAGVVDGHLCAVRIQTLGASRDVRRCGRRAGAPALQARNRTRRQPAAAPVMAYRFVRGQARRRAHADRGLCRPGIGQTSRKCTPTCSPRTGGIAGGGAAR